MTGSQLDDRLGTMVLNRLRTDDREISGSPGNFWFSDTEGSASKRENQETFIVILLYILFSYNFAFVWLLCFLKLLFCVITSFYCSIG